MRIALFLVGLLLTTHIFANNTISMVKKAVLEASIRTQLKIPNDPYLPSFPALVVLSEKVFKEQMCVPKDPCTFDAMYSPRTMTVIVNGDRVKPNSPYGQAVLIHEAVHFLHAVNGLVYNKITCFQLESEAYNAQEAFLKQYNLPLPGKFQRIENSCRPLN